MAPVIVNLCIAAATMLFRQKFSLELVIGLTYRLERSLFNLRRSKYPTKTLDKIITELQYADEALECLNSVYRDLGPVVNTSKTEVLLQ